MKNKIRMLHKSIKKKGKFIKCNQFKESRDTCCGKLYKSCTTSNNKIPTSFPIRRSF